MAVERKVMRILKSFICVLMLCSSVEAEEDLARIVTTKEQPATMKEFDEIVSPLVGKGTMEVRFNQGRWKWHSMYGLKVLDYEVSVTLKSAEEKWPKELDTWLKANREKVDWLCIRFHPEHKAVTFFKIEKVLTAHNVLYQMSISKVNAKAKLLLHNSYLLPEKKTPQKKVKHHYKKLPVAP
mgnify:CR=1 FL=1